MVFPTAPLLRRVWELRPNVAAYDACYVALAEVFGTLLLTAERRLANAPGRRCRVEAPDPMPAIAAQRAPVKGTLLNSAAEAVVLVYFDSTACRQTRSSKKRAATWPLTCGTVASGSGAL